MTSDGTTHQEAASGGTTGPAPAGADPPDGTRAALVEAVRQARAEVRRLSERIAELEAAVSAPTSAQGGATGGAAGGAVALPAGPAATPSGAELDEELVAVISAAIAAFLGKKPYIRQIRLVASPTWTHQGRVSIQGSHALNTSRR